MKKRIVKTLTQTTAEKIVELIKERGLEPGERLPNEYMLAQSLAVGRGTVREAVRSLISHNILEVRQGAGTFVSYKNGIPEDPLGLVLEDLDERLLVEMLEVRLILEPEVAAMAEEHRAVAKRDVWGARYAMTAHLNTTRAGILYI